MNNGTYYEPIFYTKVLDYKNEAIIEKKQQKRKVVSEQTALQVSEVLEAPVTDQEGTAKICKMVGNDVHVKTGTTNDKKDVWAAGFCNGYCLVTWFGYDFQSSPVKGEPALEVWANVMREVRH